MDVPRVAGFHIWFYSLGARSDLGQPELSLKWDINRITDHSGPMGLPSFKFSEYRPAMDLLLAIFFLYHFHLATSRKMFYKSDIAKHVFWWKTYHKRPPRL